MKLKDIELEWVPYMNEEQLWECIGYGMALTRTGIRKSLTHCTPGTPEYEGTKAALDKVEAIFKLAEPRRSMYYYAKKHTEYYWSKAKTKIANDLWEDYWAEWV